LRYNYDNVKKNRFNDFRPRILSKCSDEEAALHVINRSLQWWKCIHLLNTWLGYWLNWILSKRLISKRWSIDIYHGQTTPGRRVVSFRLIWMRCIPSWMDGFMSASSVEITISVYHSRDW